MIRIVDYGLGNTQAFINIFKHLGVAASRASNPEDLVGASHLILPGVGHFDHAMRLFNGSGMRPAIEDKVVKQGTPILGVCVGMQMLASSSTEGSLPGLNWIPGKVVNFASHLQTENLPTPHMGWNIVQHKKSVSLFNSGFERLPEFYFLHSFYFVAEDKEDVVATAYYGVNFDAVVSRGNIHGVQFHPEKSHHNGSQLLKNFTDF